MRWLPILVVVAVGAACDRHSPRYHVSARLIAHLEGSVPGGACAIADQLRPGLGCAVPTPRRTNLVRDAKGRSGLIFNVDGPALGKPTMVVAYWRELKRKAKWQPKWQQWPVSRSVIPRARTVRVHIPGFPPPEAAPGTKLEIRTRPWPPEVFETKPVAVAKGAVLSVGIGLDPETPPTGVAAVEFRLEADAGAGPRELLRKVIRPGTPEAAAWQDQVLPLDGVSGEATRFRFIAHLEPAPGTDRAHAVAVPLWGAPEVLVPERDDERPNVILVSLDTLRGDHVGALGAALPLTPRIDELASEGVVFETASTTYSSTTAAHLSMLTGRYPIRTGVRGPTRTLPATTALLAEALGAAGWRTAAVTEDAMLAISVGFARGVSHYQENREFEPTAPPVSYKAAHTMGTALRWIEAHRDERFFLFVHTYAVHNPYAPPAEHQFTTWTDGTTERPLSEAPGYVQLARAYAGDVRFADAQVGHLIDTVRRLGLERRTIVVVTSDHGEGFGEREGSWGHATVIHDEIMHVPMILWGPGRIPAGRRIRTPVSLVDLPPTILELAGVPPLANLDGESQAARLDGGADDLERVVFAEGRSLTDRGQRQVAARTATTKWMVTPSKPRSLVAYDLVADPGERRALTDPALLERGRRLIAGYEALATKDATPVRVPVSDDTREQLRALGYLE